MRGRKNLKQEESKESSEVLSVMEGVYSEAWQLGEGRRFKKCKEINSRAVEIRLNRRKRL